MRPKHCQSKLQLRRPARQKHLLIRHNFSKGEYLDEIFPKGSISTTLAMKSEFPKPLQAPPWQAPSQLSG